MIPIIHVAFDIGRHTYFQRDLCFQYFIEVFFLLEAVYTVTNSTGTHRNSIEYMFADSHFSGVQGKRDTFLLGQFK